MIEKVAQTPLPTDFGLFTLTAFRDDATDQTHLAMSIGNLTETENALVRVHSACATGELFRANNCDCRQQLDSALQQIAEAGLGVVVYLDQEGRGNGIIAKIQSLKLMSEENLAPAEAYSRLGYPEDNRPFDIAATILRALGVKPPIRILTNNPQKVQDLEQSGFKVSERLDLFFEPTTPLAKRHREIKRTREGHLLPPGAKE